MFIQIKLETVEEEEVAQGTSGTVRITVLVHLAVHSVQGSVLYWCYKPNQFIITTQ